jgi:ribosomal protein S18 acetylase RimI-like enzyme
MGRDEEPLISVRPATHDDFPEIERFDLTYPTDRYLALERSGDPPEHEFHLRWATRTDSPRATYVTPTVAGLIDAIDHANLFLVAETESGPIGYLMVLIPKWADLMDSPAAEITDLAVERSARRSGAGSALVAAASDWARSHSHRALWVEPRADNATAIAFYLSIGFRISGFNDRMYANDDDAPGKPTIYMHLELG